MVTGAIKNKVDKIWTDIWAGGITNPLTVIEQLTYLMFIRSLDEKELATEDFENMAGEKMEHIFPASEAGQSMRWSRFKDKDSREIFLTMQQRVFPAIKKMKYGRLPDFNEKGELVEVLSKLEQAQQEAEKLGKTLSEKETEHRLCAVHGRCHVPDPHAAGAAKDHHRAGGSLHPRHCRP